MTSVATLPDAIDQTLHSLYLTFGDEERLHSNRRMKTTGHPRN
jgi:hypothetical protein